jgi:probable phosphoglycerate mutase
VTRLIVWRHGRTEWNVAGRTQGQLDVPLDDIGHEQARAAADRLAAESPDAIVSSDLRRAADTAAALAAATGLPVRFDQRLRERHFGQWQGLTNEESAARYPEAFARWRRGEVVADAGLEELDSVIGRGAAALTDAATLGATVVVVTHGGTAKHAMAALLGWPDEMSTRLLGLGNCHWAEMRHLGERGWLLRSYNVGVVAGGPRGDRVAEVPETLVSAGDAGRLAG